MTTIAASPAARVDALPWDELGAQLDARGFAVTDRVLDAADCDALAGLFDAGRFRSTVDMARHRFGDGRYRYFAHPLPEMVEQARAGFYPHLAAIAITWAERLGEPGFPETHAGLLERCRVAG